jgi:hypothetical protein
VSAIFWCFFRKKCVVVGPAFLLGVLRVFGVLFVVKRGGDVEECLVKVVRRMGGFCGEISATFFSLFFGGFAVRYEATFEVLRSV